MLARLLRPCQRRLPVVGGLVLGDAMLAALVPGSVWHQIGWWRGLAPGIVLAVVACRRPALSLALLGCIALAGLSAQAWGGAHPAQVLALLSVVVAPVAAITLVRDPTRLRPADADQALALSAGMAHLAILLALPSGPGTAAAVALGCLGCLLLPGALQRRDAAQAPGAFPPGRDLPALAAPAEPWRWRVLAALGVALGCWLLRQPWPHGAWRATPGAALVAVLLLGTCILLLGSWLGAVLALAATTVVLATCGCDPTAPATLLGIMAPALALPLSWCWWRRQQGSGGGPAAAVAGLTALAAVGGSGSPAATGLAGLAAACVADLPWDGVWGRGSPDSATRLLARCRGRLGAYFRVYLLMKWRLDPVFRQLQADPRAWGSVLDVGCGPGLGAVVCATREGCTAYCGIDLDGEKLAVARLVLSQQRRLAPSQWRLVHGCLPFSAPLPGAYDTVLLIDVLHYWPEAGQLDLLVYLRAHLRAGGEVWLREGLADAQGESGRVGAGERFTTAAGLNPQGPLHFLTAQALGGLVERAGFRSIERLASGAENRLWRLRAD